MRSIWKGSIAFGLVNVPVAMYSATQSHDAPLHQVHDADGGRIRYLRRCEKCEQIVEYANISKAFVDGNESVMLTDEDLASLPSERSHEIEVVAFVPRDEVDVILYDSSYYLEPTSKSSKAYVLLRRTLQETDRLAIVKFAMRQKTRLAALRTRDDLIILQTLLWPDEVREADFDSLKDDVKVSAMELKMSAQLVESLSENFDPSEYTDEYQAQLQALIDRKLESGDTVVAEEPAEDAASSSGEVIDLMEALRRSVASRKGASDADEADSAETDSTEETDEADEPKPAKKATKSARKAPAKKAAKPAAKKTASKAKPKKSKAS